MKIGVIMAMSKEFEAVAVAWSDKAQINQAIRYENGCKYMIFRPTPSDEVIIMQCGIGKVNGAIGAMTIAQMGVDCIISSGVAGSLSKLCVIPGNVVIGTSYRYHDVYCGEGNEKGQIQGEPTEYDADENLLDVARKNMEKGFYFASIISGDCFVDTKEQAEKLCGQFPLSMAVDMESCAIAQVCKKKNIPFISYRVISDSILNPQAMTYKEFWNVMPKKMADFTMSYVLNVIKEYKPF